LIFPTIYFVLIGDYFLAFILFLIFAILDGVDGFVARKFNQETILGKNFDIMSDVVAAVGVMVALLAKSFVSYVYVIFLAVPLAVYGFNILRSNDLLKSNRLNSKWKNITAPIFYVTILILMIDTFVTTILSDLVLSYFYFMAVKYTLEVNKRMD